ncbi:MAG: glycoside hydrolase family 32 protein [Flavobacterium micromati]|nr:glycoside hydrolase family 32 protein [Flavobacterium micromati]
MNYKIKKVVVILTLGIVSISSSCNKENQNDIRKIESSENIVSDSSILYKEPFRPQFHFSPTKKWMNDPNGLVFHKGIYHLFYQYYPDDIVWGPMHWGHATSTDLIHWKNKKIALYPDKLGFIFSGSAVVDYKNSSGLGTKENPPLIAIFTYHNMEAEKAGKTNYQTQGLAYSLDNGENWKKYNNNPIIKNEILKDFRDPKVFWNDDEQLWNMVLVAGDRAQFYTSQNLIDWNFASEFGKNVGAHGGVWECPDIFKLKVAGSNEEKWVLLISINPGAPNGGSGTQYFIGDYDGKSFRTNQKDIKWVDNGADNYAGITYNNAPENKRIFIGWMSNWSYARNTPTKNWRSAMTLARELSLAKINDQYILQNTPVEQFKKQGVLAFAKDKIILEADSKKTFEYSHLNQSEIRLKIKNENLKLVFSNDRTDSLVLNYDAKQKIFSIDRRNSGLVNFEKSFGAKIHQTKTPYLTTETIDFQIILDWSSIEVFLNGGVYSFTEQIFPNEPYNKLILSSDRNQEISSISIKKIKGIW